MPETTKIESMNVYQRLRHAQSQLAAVAKDGTNPMYSKSGKANYVSHDAVVRYTRDALIAAGLVYNVDAADFDAEAKWVRFTCEFINVDRPDDRVVFHSPPYPLDGKDQSRGATTSYAKKYGLLMALLLPTAEDSDAPPKAAPVDADEQERRDMMREIISAQKSLGWDNTKMAKEVKATIGKATRDATITELNMVMDMLADEIKKEPEHA